MSVVTSTMTFDTTVPSVPVTARCAPITSLFRRLISAPVWVRVKNAIGMPLHVVEQRDAQVVDQALADARRQPPLDDRRARRRRTRDHDHQPGQHRHLRRCPAGASASSMIALISSGGTSPRNAVATTMPRNPNTRVRYAWANRQTAADQSGGERPASRRTSPPSSSGASLTGPWRTQATAVRPVRPMRPRTSQVRVSGRDPGRRADEVRRGVPAGGRVRLLGGGAAAGAGALRAEAAAAGAEVGVDLGEDPPDGDQVLGGHLIEEVVPHARTWCGATDSMTARPSSVSTAHEPRRSSGQLSRRRGPGPRAGRCGATAGCGTRRTGLRARSSASGRPSASDSATRTP